MAVLSPPYALGAAGQVLSGRLLRNSLGAAFVPGAGITAVSGVLAGPVNTMGELSLAAGVVTVQPFKAVIQCSSDSTAGQFVVTNDAALPLAALTAQDATRYRRGLIVVDVDDSQTAGVASSATTDRARVYPLDGALAASAGETVLPALPDNSLALGEYLIPPTGQTITLTPYNPRTTLRGGIQAAILADGQNIPGHDAYAGAHDGAYRHHPTRGLEQYETGASKWRAPRVRNPSLRLPAVAQAGIPLGGEYWVGSYSSAPDWDTDSLVNTTDRGLQVPADLGGIWRLVAVAQLVGGTDQAVFLLRLLRFTGARPANLTVPTTFVGIGQQRIWATQTTVRAEYEGPLAAGDKVCAWYYTNSAAAINWQTNVNGAPAYFYAEYRGPNPATA